MNNIKTKYILNKSDIKKIKILENYINEIEKIKKNIMKAI